MLGQIVPNMMLPIKEASGHCRAAYAAGLAIWAGCRDKTDGPTPPPQAVAIAAEQFAAGAGRPAKSRSSRRHCWRNSGILQEPMDTRISTKFFDGFLNSMDYRHEYFLQSDTASSRRSARTWTQLTVNTNMQVFVAGVPDPTGAFNRGFSSARRMWMN